MRAWLNGLMHVVLSVLCVCVAAGGAGGGGGGGVGLWVGGLECALIALMCRSFKKLFMILFIYRFDWQRGVY